MTVFLALTTTLAATWLRLAFGASSAFVPWVGLAWTVLFARHSRRATFAAPALVLGAIDGIAAPAAWTAWPLLYLATGTLLYATRRVLPVRNVPGEVVLGTLAAALVRGLALLLPPPGLPVGFGAFGPGALGLLLTGVVSGVLLALGRGWSPLRMKLAKVS
jgi:hypothetical protein